MITCQLPIQEIADPNVPNLLRHYIIAPPSTRRLGRWVTGTTNSGTPICDDVSKVGSHIIR